MRWSPFIKGLWIARIPADHAWFHYHKSGWNETKWVWRNSGMEFMAGESGINPETSIPTLRFVQNETLIGVKMGTWDPRGGWRAFIIIEHYSDFYYVICRRGVVDSLCLPTRWRGFPFSAGSGILISILGLFVFACVVFGGGCDILLITDCGRPLLVLLSNVLVHRLLALHTGVWPIRAFGLVSSGDVTSTSGEGE